MKRLSIVLLSGLLLLGAACNETAPPGPAERSVSAEATPAAEPGEILPRPFTAGQIRDEWIVGLELTLRRATPEGESYEHWQVVAADSVGVEIRSDAVDAEGNEIGEPRVQSASWEELRDHATFPAASGTVEEVERETPLGTLAGLLYTVREEDGSVSEYFFGRDLPGAPVRLRVTRGGELVMELEQIERQRPEEPESGAEPLRTLE